MGKGKRFALAIGISEYGDGFEALPGSLLDLHEIKSLLADRGDFEVSDLENCDRNQMSAEIEHFFRGREPDDLLLLYFSGHGDLGSGGILHQQLHLCASNSHKQDKRIVESSAMSAEFLKRQMDLSKSQQIIVILDCCYSGAMEDLLKKGDEGIDYNKLKGKGRVILASSSPSKVALQAVDGLSLYTSYLKEGIEGAAYKGHGDWIVAQDLHAYAERRFEVESKGGYLPKIIAEDTGYNLPIAKAPKRDPKLEYRQAVDHIFQELDHEFGLEFDGVIIDDSLERDSLQTSQLRLGISPEAASEIEMQVQKPYLVRAKQRKTYAESLKRATKDGYLPTAYSRRRLDEIRLNLLLGEEDAQDIEQQLSLQLNLKPRPNPSAASAGVKSTSSTSLPNEEPKLLTLDCGDGVTLELVRIPAGSFQMGMPAAERKIALENAVKYGNKREDVEKWLDWSTPVHQVNLQAFFMGKYAVTQKQWQAVMGNNPSNFKGENLPVETVSWHEARGFCRKLSEKTGQEVRLPTEAEWEYACRAGTTTPFAFGETITTDLVNYNGNYPYGDAPKDEYRQKTVDVDSFSPNAWGLYQMHGNVWEWCLDGFHDNYSTKPDRLKKNGNEAWGDSEIYKNDNHSHLVLLRGGSWYNVAWYCRSANRFRDYADDSNDNRGFRVVASASASVLS